MEFSLQEAMVCAMPDQMEVLNVRAQLVRIGYGLLHLSEDDQMLRSDDH
jgi:hypothetical protein